MHGLRQPRICNLVLQHFETRTEKVLFVALLVLFVAATSLSLASVAYEVRQPSPGFVVWSNLVVPAIGTSTWPGRRAGIPLRSVLVAANGRPLKNAQELRDLVRELPLGTAVRYTFRAGERSIDVAVPTTTFGWRHILPAYSGYLIAGLSFLATALIVFYFMPELPAARATLALGTVLGMAMILALDLFSRFWLQRLYFCFESLMPGALLHVALCFPEEKDVVRRHPNLRWLVYVPFVPLAFLQNYLLDIDPAAQLRVNDWVYTATAGAGIIAFASLIHAFRAARTPRARQQAKVVLGAAAGAAFVPSLGLLSITLLGSQIPMNLLAPFFILFPLSMAYAIARHDLFSVDRYLRLGVVYAVLSVAIVVPYGLLVIGAQLWLGSEDELPRGLIPLYVFAAVILFDPLRSRIQTLVDRLFYRQAYTYRGTVEATTRTLATALDTALIARTLLSTLTDVMGIEWAVLLPSDANHGTPRAFGRPNERADACAALFPPGDPRLANLTRRLGPLIREDTRRSRSGDENGAIDGTGFQALGADLVMPLRFRDQSIGTVLIGPKHSGAYYTDEDLNLLDTLLHQTALALTNARAYEIIRDTQDELVEAERMAAVGELAAAVAHGIRNPLAGIRGTAQVAREDAEGDPRLARDLDNILSEADRLERRVRSILELAGPMGLQVSAAAVGEFLSSFASQMRPRLPAGVDLSLEVAQSLPLASFDATRLGEVLETIVANAIEAMGSSGSLTIAARLDEDAGSPRIAISVADNGPGIPSAALGRVFDLFYTTKTAGTGVGLAIAKRLVERQGGTIEARNAATGGAVITIRLAVAGAVTERRS